jgi:hypothetical protein
MLILHNCGTTVSPTSIYILGPSDYILPVSYAQIASSTRLRALTLLMRLESWDFTVLMLMFSSAAISWLVRPRAMVSRISSSRSVSGGNGCTGVGVPAALENVERSRAVMLGAMRASPAVAGSTGEGATLKDQLSRAKGVGAHRRLAGRLTVYSAGLRT